MTTLPTLDSASPLASPKTDYRRICVVGLGYVGLPTALLFAQQTYSVHGVDINPEALQRIQDNKIGEVYEELADWAQLVANKQANEPNFTVDTQPVPSDVFIITVPTPVDAATKYCDLTAVKAACQSIVPVLRPGNLVILESTVPPGTTRNVVKPILEQSGLSAERDFYLAFCPERILPGNTVNELVNNHRIIGGYTHEAAALGKQLFQSVITGDIYLTDDKSAEFCKLAENTYRDVNIALANELSIIADEHDINLKAIQPLINQHPRVNLLTPGIGVGGHCIAVDPWFFVEVSPWKTELIRTAREVNNRMPEYCVQQIVNTVNNIENPKICCVGLTYKPDVADTRESPAMRIVELLKARGLDVVTYDPLLPEYSHQTLLDAAQSCDYLAVLVNHTTIKTRLLTEKNALKAVLRTPNIHIF